MDARLAGEKRILELSDLEEFHSQAYESARLYREKKGGMTSTICHSIFTKGNKFSSTIPDLIYSLAS
ncbi:hypothetical protein GQ457_15G016300 [Hibiscus cannabinus]